MSSASHKLSNGLLGALAASAVILLATSAPLARPQAAAVAPPPAFAPDEGPLVAEGPPADLAIIYTGGVVGYVEPCG